MVFNILIDNTSGVTLLTSSFIVYLIFYKSPPMMSTYKKYLLANVLLEMLTVVILSLGKPRVLYTLSIAYTTGLLPIQGSIMTRLSFVFWSNTLVWSSTCLTLIHIERYFTLHQGWKTSNRFICPTFFIWFYLILNILVLLGLVIPGVFGDVYIDGPIVPNYVVKIEGGAEFLQKFPGTVLFNTVHTVWISIYYASLTIAVIFIIIPLFTFLFLNAFSGIKAVNSNNYSPKTKKVQLTLLRASMIQALLLLILAVIPIFFLVGSLLAGQMFVEMRYMQCILNIYPLGDNIIILLFVKPYRDFIFSHWRKNSVKEYSGKT